MPITRRTLIAAAAGVGATAVQTAPRLGRAQAANTIRIGVLNDQSGLYSHIGGVNGVAMAQVAAASSRPAASRWRCCAPTTRTGPTSAPTSPGSGSTATAWT
jgi:hypothetical protein